jgi:hypothetical protein
MHIKECSTALLKPQEPLMPPTMAVIQKAGLVKWWWGQDTVSSTAGRKKNDAAALESSLAAS